MPTLETLKAELRQVEEKLADAEGRMPAHSVRPGQMAAVFQLEEERDALLSEIKAIGRRGEQLNSKKEGS